MRRRAFITLLGGAAAAWPLGAHAQQPPMPIIGLLDPTSPAATADRMRGFHRGLKDTGYVEGENVAIAYRWADGQNDRLSELAAELVRQRVAVIAAAGGSPSPKQQPRQSPSSSPKTRSGLVLSPASPVLAATSQGSIFLVASWWRSGSNSYAIWCPERLALPCSSIRQTLPIPQPR